MTFLPLRVLPAALAFFLTVMAPLAALPVADSDEEPAPKMGFIQGHIYMALSGGSPAAPAGTLVSHEREYDKFIRAQSVAGNLPVQILNYSVSAAVLPTMSTSFQAGHSTQSDIEYAVSRHIGAGISYSHMSFTFVQTDAFAGISPAVVGGQPTLVRQNYVFALPISNELYNGGAVLAAISLHLNAESVFDPYAAVRVGVVSFSSWGHQGFDIDPYRYFRSPRGSGTAVVAAMGMNLHFSREYGLRTEVSGEQQVLKSGFFSRRTLNTFQVTAGLIVNLTRFTGTEI